ncbi:MAG: penicillin-binding transpeptidase domain-containing protein [Acidibacillus sp.]|nr:penicillin-binding transpeptidase domain-containing protein [Acidibacillus sp.]
MRHPIRTKSLQVGFIVLAGVVLFRIWHIQTADQFLKVRAQSQWEAQDSVQPMRGSIYDANNGILAYDAPSYDMDIDLQAIQSQSQTKRSELAQGLAQLTGAPVSTMTSELDQPNTIWLRMYPYLVHVPLSTKESVLHLFSQLGMSNDVHPYKTYERIYPDGTFASEVIGFTDQHGHGAAGVELQYNKYLAGVPGISTFTQDTFGDPVPFDPITVKPVQNGDNVYLTINSVIQHYAEQALAVVQQRFSPAHAAIIVADPTTGAILAMATIPNYNPNYFWKYPSSTLDTNWAISDPFEPGSTFKTVTLTGALATHSIQLNQTYMSGVDVVDGVPIHDWNVYGWGRLTYLQAMIYSSNVGFIHIGQAEGVQNFYHYLNLFGMTRKTGIDLPGEGNPIIFPEANLNPVDFATMTFGQGLAVTPIQQVAAVGAIANGGNLLTPYVVQKVVSPTGQVVYDHHIQVVDHVASASVMQQVTNAMVQVVNEDPQGNVGELPGYTIAGKTGTAQIPKPTGGYYKNLYNLSFIGFVPAHHPQLEIYVTVSEAHNTGQWGDWVATPAARYVLQKSLAYLDIPPHTSSTTTVTHQSPYITTPNVVGLPVQTAITILERAGFQAHEIGASGRVVRQWPAKQSKAAPGSNAWVLTPSNQIAGKVQVPNLTGMLMTEAMHVCSLLGIQIIPNGAGYALSQNVTPGQYIPVGSTLTVTFGPTP